jgi:pilus assembly protein CpaE
MSNLAYDSGHDVDVHGQDDAAAMQTLRPVPRISIQAFCETESVANPIERAADDRRMSKAHLKVHSSPSTATRPPRWSSSATTTTSGSIAS